MTNRIKAFREAADLTQQELADRAGVDKSTVYRYEKERTSLFQDNVLAIARVLGLKSPEEFVSIAPSQIQLVGNVGAGAEVLPLDEENEWLQSPPGMRNPLAVRVVGRSMLPVYRPGDILFAERDSKDDPVGSDCLVQVEGGPRLVKRVQAGSIAGRYRLYSYDTQDESDDLLLEWTAPVRWVAR